MTFPLEYHKGVQRSIPASLACFGTFLLPLLLVSVSPAQFNNAVSSSSAHSMSAPPTGSVAPFTGGVAPRTGAVAPPTGAGVAPSHVPHSPGISHNTSGQRRHSSDGTAYYYPYLYYYGVPVPYAADSDAGAPDQNDADDADYQGGPTIFDRRGSGAESYVPPVSDRQAGSQPQNPTPATYADLDPPQPPTSLVFKDGHQVEVANYAIVSQTLYDLTPGHHRKIALADLDLPATEKQNDDRGVTFQLPPTAQAN
jgi:hypothetical protein